VLKASCLGNSTSLGSGISSGRDGDGALTMAAKKSRSSLRRASGVSPAKFSAVFLFRPVKAFTTGQTTRFCRSGPADVTARTASLTAACCLRAYTSAKASSASTVGRLVRRSLSSLRLASVTSGSLAQTGSLRDAGCISGNVLDAAEATAALMAEYSPPAEEPSAVANA
jgi:hypothetical protein